MLLALLKHSQILSLAGLPKYPTSLPMYTLFKKKAIALSTLDVQVRRHNCIRQAIAGAVAYVYRHDGVLLGQWPPQIGTVAWHWFHQNVISPRDFLWEPSMGPRLV